MVAPALPAIAKDFNIKSDIEQYLVMSIFLLAYAIGPFVLAPLSEMRGRVVVLQSANLVYLIFNTVCGFSQSRKQILAFRFLSGLGASASQAVCLIPFQLSQKLIAMTRLEVECSATAGELMSEELLPQFIVWLHFLRLQLRRSVRRCS